MLHILGMGCSHPETVITNQFLEELDVGTSESWILEKIGIHERVTSLPLDYIKETRNQNPALAEMYASTTTTKLGTEASRRALQRSGLLPEDVGLIICNTCTPDKTVPSQAQQIAAALGIEVKAYDVVSACPAFALHMDFLNKCDLNKLPEFILCISTATLTQNVNYNDRTDGAIWGDGAAAWIVTAQHSGRLKVVDTFFASDPTRCSAVVVDRYGFFHQDGRAVRDFSVRQTVRLIKRVEEEYQMNWERDIFIGHQANRTMLEQITGNRNIPASNHWHNVSYLGNQAGAGAPATLSQRWDDIQSNTKILVAVVGAGLSWGSVLMEAA
jgi:3-oxoacyl-[acyl-carrier-protein] synthase III